MTTLLPWGACGALAVLAAFAVDTLAGEPPARWHPVVWMGRALSRCGAPWPAASPAAAFLRGMTAWMVGAAASVALAAAACAVSEAVTPRGPAGLALRALLLGLLLKPLLAWRLLRDEVAEVEQALAVGLDAGRSRLRFLVSRDTAALGAVEVRESALESLAENLNDSFVAPLFWFVLGGLPVAALYRFANTADAMWGYRGRWEWAGKWSARADDVLSFVPARLTALLLAAAAPCWPRLLRSEARRTPSPNGGWPMAMMASALGVRLSKPGVYVLNGAGRPAEPMDTRRGLEIAARAALLAIIAAAALLMALGGRA